MVLAAAVGSAAAWLVWRDEMSSLSIAVVAIGLIVAGVSLFYRYVRSGTPRRRAAIILSISVAGTVMLALLPFAPNPPKPLDGPVDFAVLILGLASLVLYSALLIGMARRGRGSQ
jgi:drug/metabolite transporter (DMT)-like permease